MASNTNIQLADLDFAGIKQNFITYLQSQDVLKDYDYTGSALSVLLDVLAYNTQYNAFYLNMVANEMFLDTAIHRASVVSHAKLLNYTPRSAIAPTAIISMNVYNVTAASLTIPQHTRFISDAIDGVNYTFLTVDDMTVNTDANNICTFSEFEIKQAVVGSSQFEVDLSANPRQIFTIPDTNIDTTTLTVMVQQSTSNTNQDTYYLATDYSALTSNTRAYFLQEGTDGFYQIYFGDNNLGKSLDDGNIVYVSFLSTKGLAGVGANNFTLVDTIGGYGTTIITPILPATKGMDKESIDSIKFQAPKSYAAQNRAVTKEDYVTLLQQNKFGIPLDAVSVWGGDEMNPPQYGYIFASVKPTGGYALTDAQKNVLIEKVIKPASVMTVIPQIVTPDYVYMLVDGNIVYDPTKTRLTSTQIQTIVKKGVTDFCKANLNTFNSVFSVGDLISYIRSLDRSFIGVDFDLGLQKRVLATLGKGKNYTVNFRNKLRLSGNKSVTFPDSFAQYDTAGNYYPAVYFEESPVSLTYVDYAVLTNGGSNYTNPVVTILGDGSGAKAVANVTNGIITGIQITDAGQNYTQAIVNISDATGTGAAATAAVTQNFSKLRTYYFDNQIKNIFTDVTSSSSAGTIDYDLGTVTLNNFIPSTVNSLDGLLRINAVAAERIVYSTFEQIITLDETDASAININVTTR